jgi:hypothetical protein
MADAVRAEIEIDAPIERVWDILHDLPSYEEWNPFTPKVESTLQVGDPIHLHVRLRSPRLTHRVEFVTALEPLRKMCWNMKMGARFLLYAERCQTLTEIAPGRIHYITEDRFSGWLTGLVMRLFGDAMQRGFTDCAVALKKRAESH